ncbi:hypothetical protein KW794_03015 [Candidatus Saccharibacteria bacterium]|nr:hypothetical protein [Candidatus Saccharibacteria bacterium]
MVKIERSIDIVLSEHPPEEDFREPIVVPLTSDEALITSRGLARHIDILYKSVAKVTRDYDKALLSVYNFLEDDVDRYRQRVHNLSSALSPEKVQQFGSKAFAAAAISYLLTGEQSRKAGVWRQRSDRQKQLIEVFHQLMASDELTFFELQDWAGKQSSRNAVYWRRQLEGIRQNPYIVDIRQAVEESDHFVEV